jgi:hypothetical protein
MNKNDLLDIAWEDHDDGATAICEITAMILANITMPGHAVKLTPAHLPS